MRGLSLVIALASVCACVAAAAASAEGEPAPAAAPPPPPPPPPAPPEPAPPAPTADEIRHVTEYYLHGAAGGPVLMEAFACKKIGKNAEGKTSCEERTGATAHKGDPLIAYVKFFVPKGAKYDDLKVRFLVNNEVRSTSDFTLSESWTGYANYKQTTASKVGTWELQVLRGDVLLSKQTVQVE